MVYTKKVASLLIINVRNTGFILYVHVYLLELKIFALDW